MRAIRAVANGEAMDLFSGESPKAPQALPGLAAREEVLTLMARGRGNAEIAAELFLSLKTVQNHVSNVFRKLRAADRVGAAIRAREAGWGRPRMTKSARSHRIPRMVSVLFVCMGNICRSPVAQGVFEDVLRREGLAERVSVDSAGTGDWHVGEPPDERAVSSAAVRGLDISGQRARQLVPEDCGRFDYVLTMDEAILAAVGELCPGSAVVRPFLDFAPSSPEREVPDPYFGGPEGFERVLDLVEEASEGLISDIRSRHLDGRG